MNSRILFSLVFSLLILSVSVTVGQAADATSGRSYDLRCTIDSVASRNLNPYIVLPVRMENITDSVAGFQLWITSSDPQQVRFAVDTIIGDNVYALMDTAGIRTPDWVFVAQILDVLHGLVKVTGIYLPQPLGSGPLPPGNGVLVNLVMETNGSLTAWQKVPVMHNDILAEFSDPQGNRIGCDYDSLGHCIIDTTRLVLRDGLIDIYVCGDANMDDQVDISDVVWMIQCVFGPCDIFVYELLYKAFDANCDGVPDISDIVYLIHFIFGGGPAPCEYCT